MNRPLSQAVLAAVASAEGVDARNLSDPLYDVIDPDALDTLFRNGSGLITFDYIGYRVSVDSDATVEVERIGGDGENATGTARSGVEE